MLAKMLGAQVLLPGQPTEIVALESDCMHLTMSVSVSSPKCISTGVILLFIIVMAYSAAGPFIGDIQTATRQAT